jgi:hypothetical protein
MSAGIPKNKNSDLDGMMGGWGGGVVVEGEQVGKHLRQRSNFENTNPDIRLNCFSFFSLNLLQHPAIGFVWCGAKGWGWGECCHLDISV